MRGFLHATKVCPRPELVEGRTEVLQMLGFDILDWAEQGVVGDLNDLAAEEKWDAVVPAPLQKFSKYDDDWIAAPVNVHSTNWIWAAKAILEPSFQSSFNKVKGSVPARTDVSVDDFDDCGKKAMADLKEAAASDHLMGSMAHGHAAPAAVKNAVYDVVTNHFNGEIKTSEEAVERLVAAVQGAPEGPGFLGGGPGWGAPGAPPPPG